MTVMRVGKVVSKLWFAGAVFEISEIFEGKFRKIRPWVWICFMV
jgi:hypothetical protein